jgi:hypothetical protein
VETGIGWLDQSASALRTEAALMLTLGMVVLALVTFAAMLGFVVLCEHV